ncbi:MAG: hypothetical protein R3Y50_08835 [Rikenellaceae bacterium]
MYDESSHLIEKSRYWGSSLDSQYKYTINSSGLTETMKKYGDDGSLDESWEYTYDEQNRLSIAKKMDIVLSTIEERYSYNGNDITVEEYICNDENILNKTTNYEYDEYNNLVKETCIIASTGAENIQELNKYEYNSKGQVLKKTSSGGIINDRYTYEDYTYNTDGTIANIHVTYSYKTDISDLDYSYKDLY